MKSVLRPWQLFLFILAGWVNRQQRLVLFGEESLRRAVRDFLAHYHAERNHQSLDNRLIEPDEGVGRTTGEIACRERMGGMLRYYYRKAA